MKSETMNVHCNINPQRLPLNGNAHRQAAANGPVLRWKASAHPITAKKNIVGVTGKVNCLFVTSGKVHFCDQKCPLPAFTCCKRHFEKPNLAQIGPILAAFIHIMGPESPPKQCQNVSKSPKNGVWGLFGPFGCHFYPFYIDFQRNKK